MAGLVPSRARLPHPRASTTQLGVVRAHTVRSVICGAALGCPTTLAPDAQPRYRLLVVDDDEDIRETLQAVFESEGYLVTTASNGLEALDRLRTMPTAPCVIVLDLMMPVMSG